MLRSIVTTACAALLAAPAARAQDLTDICRRVEHPPVGSWSEFRVVGGRDDGATTRMAVVGSETRADTSYVWIESAVHGLHLPGSTGRADTTAFVSKVLVRGFGVGMDQPREAIVKIGSTPAMEMPVNGSGSGPLDDCASSKVVGWESVTVPAGTFRALHVQDQSGGGDAWIVPDLPFAVVKTGATAADSSQMVLVSHGAGARSVITEAPRPFDQSLFMKAMTHSDSDTSH